MYNRPGLPRSLAGRAHACALACAIVLSLAVSPAVHAQQSDSVEVHGAVKNSLRLAPDDLRAFPAAQIGEFTQTRRTESGESSSTVRGVKLTAVLDRAGLAGQDNNDWKSAVVVATATDGYRVVFSWPELFNSPLGANVLVLFERDGQALASQEGRIALISGGDQRLGPRHVRWLRTVEVRLFSKHAKD